MKLLRNTILFASAFVLAANVATATHTGLGENHNMETAWPGSICVPDGPDMNGNVDYFPSGTVENEKSSSVRFHCGLTSRVNQVQTTESCGADCWDIDSWIITNPSDEVHIRVYDGNDAASVTCDLERRSWNRSTGATSFHESDSDSSSSGGTGADTLRPLLSDAGFTDTAVYFYHVRCTLPGSDVSTSKIFGLVAEWDGA